MIADLEFWRMMEERIAEKRRDERNKLGGGGARDHAEYRYGVGKIEAYRNVLLEARQVYARLSGHPEQPEPLPDDSGDDFPI